MQCISSFFSPKLFEVAPVSNFLHSPCNQRYLENNWHQVCLQLSTNKPLTWEPFFVFLTYKLIKRKSLSIRNLLILERKALEKKNIWPTGHNPIRDQTRYVTGQFINVIWSKLETEINSFLPPHSYKPSVLSQLLFFLSYLSRWNNTENYFNPFRDYWYITSISNPI